MRSFALRVAPVLGLVLSLVASSAAQAVEPSVRRVSLKVGETFRTSANQVRNFAVDPVADAAELTVSAEQFSLEGRHPGQTALVLIDNAGQARLIVIDVVAGGSQLVGEFTTGAAAVAGDLSDPALDGTTIPVRGA